jgi:hypothetical protein
MQLTDIIPKDEALTMPPEEWFAGKRVLELGNKKNANGLYRDAYVSNGATYTCVDWNGQDGAVAVDMGKDFGVNGSLVGKADLVTNFGFTEHVFTDQVQCWYNVLAMASKAGCWVSSVTPYPGHWDHHGVYQPTPRWIMDFLEKNGFAVRTHWTNVDRRRWVICVAAIRVEEWHPDVFVYPDPTYRTATDQVLNGIYITPPGKRVNRAERECGVKP